MKKHKKQTPAPAPAKELSKVRLGQLKAEELRLRTAGLSDARIAERRSENALSLGLSIEDFSKQLETVSAKSDTKKSVLKESYRVKFDRLTDNLCVAINQSTDERVISALSSLIDWDCKYQSEVDISQTTRTDFRGLILLSPHFTERTILARYIGGWGDGSKKDRDQYSNGRRVPQSKSTGYKKEQTIPVWTETL